MWLLFNSLCYRNICEVVMRRIVTINIVYEFVYNKLGIPEKYKEETKA